MNAREVDAELARAWQALAPGENVGPVTYRAPDRAELVAVGDVSGQRGPKIAEDTPEPLR